MIESQQTPCQPAPRWHTGLLVALIVAVAIAGRLGGTPLDVAATSSRVVAVYLPLLGVQAMLVLYVARVLRPPGTLAALVGPRPRAVDFALAVAGFVVVEAVELGVDAAMGSGRPRAVDAILPRTPLELAAWVVVGVAVAFGEEVVYRGYLRAQLAAFSRSPAAGVVLQAALFGLAHADQGAFTGARFAVYGAGLGVLAQRRGGLAACIGCHALIDVAAGFLGAG